MHGEVKVKGFFLEKLRAKVIAIAKDHKNFYLGNI
jgi:hypothetical protein